MVCNRRRQPEFTKEQIAECQKCKHASAKKTWCCLFGRWIKEGQGQIVIPSKKLLRPMLYRKGKNAGFATREDRFRHQYKIALNMAGNGRFVVTEDVFLGRRRGCVICPPEDKQGCPCVGCKRWNELVFADTKCPKGRW